MRPSALILWLSYQVASQSLLSPTQELRLCVVSALPAVLFLSLFLKTKNFSFEFFLKTSI